MPEIDLLANLLDDPLFLYLVTIDATCACLLGGRIWRYAKPGSTGINNAKKLFKAKERIVVIQTVDAHVGKCIRHRRWMTNKTQQELAQAVGIRFQQIQKYETGKNRVSASRLWDIASALDVPVSFFFKGLKPEADSHSPSRHLTGDILTEKETLDLLRSYYGLPVNQRRKLLDLARSMTKAA